MKKQCSVKVFSKIFLILTTMLTVSCATKPFVFSPNKVQGKWEAKVQIKELDTGKVNVVRIDVVAKKDQALRMEVSGTLGVHVASVLLRGDQIEYAVHTQKRYFSGPVTERSLRPLLHIQVEPRWFYPIFFDEPINNKNWTCLRDQNQVIASCERLEDHLKITWSEREGEKKRVTVANDQFDLQMVVKDFTTKVEAPEKVFSMQVPSSYKRYKLK
ncbi:MAG: hypothetical protein COT73_07865 [Bdellovibrio sp. CG10_big_fil_rev_8_21_14_0_10_47_8]|nr:MAG: hypothetical protein COT73_07865 [Bdellovibrio sp. CG10_big_fil_rev_8_21_14_0_10_47_8]